MDSQVADLIKAQINKEFFSSYLYLAISNYYIEKNLDGFGHWFDVQAREELDHALMFLKYMQDNDEKVELGAIAAPDIKYTDFKQPLSAALEHEKYITNQINIIFNKAREVNDYRCCQFLEWFIKEQGEEEKNASDLVGKFDLFAHDARGLYLLNAELKARPGYTPPANEDI